MCIMIMIMCMNCQIKEGSGARYGVFHREHRLGGQPDCCLIWCYLMDGNGWIKLCYLLKERYGIWFKEEITHSLKMEMELFMLLRWQYFWLDKAIAGRNIFRCWMDAEWFWESECYWCEYGFGSWWTLKNFGGL